jgi:hypothetical protein
MNMAKTLFRIFRMFFLAIFLLGCTDPNQPSPSSILNKSKIGLMDDQLLLVNDDLIVSYNVIDGTRYSLASKLPGVSKRIVPFHRQSAYMMLRWDEAVHHRRLYLLKHDGDVQISLEEIKNHDVKEIGIGNKDDIFAVWYAGESTEEDCNSNITVSKMSLTGESLSPVLDGTEFTICSDEFIVAFAETNSVPIGFRRTTGDLCFWIDFASGVASQRVRWRKQQRQTVKPYVDMEVEFVSVDISRDQKIVAYSYVHKKASGVCILNLESEEVLYENLKTLQEDASFCNCLIDDRNRVLFMEDSNLCVFDTASARLSRIPLSSSEPGWIVTRLSSTKERSNATSNINVVSLRHRDALNPPDIKVVQLDYSIE